MNRWLFQIELKDITYLDKIIKDINTILGLHTARYKSYPNIIIVETDVNGKGMLNSSISDIIERVKKLIQKYTREYNILSIKEM